LKNLTRVRVVTHLENEEFWLKVFEFPLIDGLVGLNLGVDSLYFSSLKIVPTEKKLLSRCHDYSQENQFIDCFRRNFSERLEKKVDCIIPGDHKSVRYTRNSE